MVRNTTGGSKTKSIARKSVPSSSIDYVPSDPLEKIAKVSKIFGNGMCLVSILDPQQDIMCHIRGKFRGKSKKNNNITVNSFVVIGLREWENPYKNCDLISVLSNYIDKTNNKDHSHDHESFIFSNEDTNDDHVLPQKIPTSEIITEEDEIDIDDI